MKVQYGLEVAYGSNYDFKEAQALLECLENRAPSCGKKVKEFEDAFAAYCGATYGIAVTSATTGLSLAGIAAGVGPGTEVITTPISWVATSFAYSALGADIVFCDVEPGTLNMDPEKLEALITPRTKAIVPVHLYGQCCRMDKIMEIARRKGVLVIEDCAHNPGGSYGGVMSGNLGDIGVFSFHQQKNMSTLGEGGMITTSTRALFERMISYRSLCARVYGTSDKYLTIDEAEHPMGKQYWKLMFDDIGYNYRMTDAQAAVGLVQLGKLGRNNARRIELSEKLTGLLRGTKHLILPEVDEKGQHVWHIYMVQLAKESPVSKDDFMWELYHTYGIKAWSHYLPIHLQKPYVERGHKAGECPVAEEAFERYVTLPMNPNLTDEAIEYMAASIIKLLGR